MSFLAKRKAQKHLPPEAAHLVHEQRLEASHTMPEWVQLVDTLTEYEREAKESMAARFDQLMVPFLRVLDQDVPAGRSVALRIDLRPSTSPDKQYVERELDVTGTSYRKLVEHWYWDVWFSGEAALAGGSQLQWSIADRVRERVINSRSASGRNKTKKKHKVTRRIDVTLSLAADRWVPVEPGTSVPWVTVKSRPSTKRHQISGRSQYPLTNEDMATELHRFMLVVTQVYRHAAPAARTA